VKLLKSMLMELLALFVDDGSLVIAVIAWVVTDVLCLRAELLAPATGAVVLAAGIAVLLAENVLRAARLHVLTPRANVGPGR
jgi:hypothetical protein